MKKVLLCAAALAIGGMSFGQEVLREKVPTLSTLNDARRIGVIEGVQIDNTIGEGEDGLSGAEAAGDVIWSEDFGGSTSVPAGWTNTVIAGPAGFPGWVHSDFVGGSVTGEFTAATETMVSATAANGQLFLLTDEGNNPGGSTEHHVTLMTPAIDVSTVGGIWINFEHKFRSCCSGDFALNLEVYQDAQMANLLADFDIRNENAVNAASADPKVEAKHFVNTTGISQIFVVWRWNFSSHYYWQLDDINIQEAADEELTLDFWWYNGKDDESNYALFYTFVPAKQMAAWDFTLGGIVSNKGNLDQTNVSISGTVTGPGGAQSGSGNPIASLLSQTSDSTDANNVTGFTEDLGTYTATWNVSSDAIANEFDMTDNVHSEDWESTGITYSRAVDETGIQFIQARTTNEILAVTYDFLAADQITAVDIYWGANAGAGLITEGATINVYLYNLTVDGFDNPIPVADFHDITASEVGTFARYTVNPGVSVAAGESWAAAVEVITETANGPYIGIDDQRDPSPFQVYECVGCQFGQPGSGPTDGWYFHNFRGSIPEIVVVTSPATSLCDGVNIVENPGSPAEITYDLTNETADISTISPVGGAAPYTFLWSGPDAGVDGSTLPNASDISVLGLYTVLITDDNGCTGTLSFNIDNTDQGNGPGNISVDDVNAAQFAFSIFPNPNNGEFFLNVDNGASGNYDMTVVNVLGEQVHASSFLVSNGQARESVNLQHLSTGIYMVNVTNGSIEQTTRVVIE